MILIIGLGNPGEKYKNTRHNLGFMTLDKLTKGSWIKKEKFKSLIYPLNSEVMLLKPQTFMNNSGEAAVKAASFYKVKAKDIWVVHDDLDLKLGQLKVKIGGRTAGHKGLKSIVSCLKTQDFVRFRLGIDHSSHNLPTERYVLLPFKDKDKEKKDLTALIGKAAEAIELALRGNLTQAMNRFN